MKVTKKIRNAIKAEIEKNQPQCYWDRFEVVKKDWETIIEKGLDAYQEELYERNIDYIFSLEDEVAKEFIKQYPDYDENDIADLVREYVCVDLNFASVLRQLPNITCLAYVHSNYDCCNSFDKFEPHGYIYDVYHRVKAGVKKDDYMWEFHNGAYGGSLFCFAFKTSIENYFALVESMKEKKTITIPKGTQFGFFSSFQGAVSIFEKTTYRKMTMPITGDTEYDCIAIKVDEIQHYSMRDVYGDNNFIKEVA